MCEPCNRANRTAAAALEQARFAEDTNAHLRKIVGELRGQTPGASPELTALADDNQRLRADLASVTAERDEALRCEQAAIDRPPAVPGLFTGLRRLFGKDRWL